MATYWDEQWPRLRHGDVFPLPLASETNWTGDGWEVNVIMLDDVTDGGYSSSTIWSHREPYQQNDQSQAEAERVRKVALSRFGQRLSDLLADPVE